MQVDANIRQKFFSEASPKAPELEQGLPCNLNLDDINLDQLPRHIAIIMDGNGRWAQKRGWDRSKGHLAGIDALRETVTACVRLGIDALTVYAFSTENWKRPAHEVNLLMTLFAKTLMKELPLFLENNVQLRFLGDLKRLPKNVQESFAKGVEKTAQNSGMIFSLAVNYGARSEILRAALQLHDKLHSGVLVPEQVTEKDFAQELYTAELQGLADPDLLIRTSGELRLSNFLLWQLAYSEIYVTERFWPDFDRFALLEAIKSYQSRKRRFGGLDSE